MLDIQRNWQSKLSNVPLSINVFSFLFLHYVDNIVSIELYRKEWNLIESISNLLTLHTVWRVVHSYLGISTSRWAPTSWTGGVLLRAKIIFLERDFLSKMISSYGLVLFSHVFTFFFFCLFLLAFFHYLFLSLFFVYFHIWFIFIIFYFQHTYFFFLSHLEHRLHQQALNDKLDK